MENINKVTLRGRITRMYSNPRITLITLAVRDYGGKRDSDGRLPSNRPVIAFFGKEGEEIASNFQQNDHITVTAKIQNTYNHLQLEGRQECWGITAEKTPAIAEAAGSGKGRLYPDDINEVIICGKVTNVAVRGNWIRISVHTATDGYRSTNFVSYHLKTGAEAYAKSLTKGSTVTVIGRLVTVERPDKKDKTGKKKKSYEDVIVREIVIENRASGGPEE